jgi:hypothetical protein
MRTLLLLSLLGTACAGPQNAKNVDWSAYKTVGIEVHSALDDVRIEKMWLGRLIKADFESSGRYRAVYLIPDDYISADLILRVTLRKLRRGRYMKMYLNLEFVDGGNQQLLGGRKIITKSEIRLRTLRDRHKASGQLGKKVAKLALAYLDTRR